MHKKDGTPDFRFAANRTAYRTAGTGSEKSSLGFGFEARLYAEYFGESNKKAYVLRDFRDELLKIEPNVIDRLFALTKGYWCENTAKKNEMPYDFRWLNKSTPDVVYSEYTKYKDKFEQLIDAKESTPLVNYRDVVGLINGFLENKLKPLHSVEDKKLFETNIEILNVIISGALDVETKVISENLKNETLREEKENIRFQNWVKKHGYCTVNREQTYDYGLKQYSLLTRTELVNIKQEIPNYLWSKNDSSVRWLKHIDYTKQALIKLKYLSEDELMFIKKEYIDTSLDPGVCELELERRLNLNFWKKIYEIVFVRLEFNPEYLIRLLFSTFRIWIKGKKST